MTAVGDRVRLVSADDPYTLIEPGEEGVVRLIDSLGTIHVDWDSGSNLGLIPEAGDRWEVISESRS